MTDGFLIKNGLLETYTLRNASVIIPDNVYIIGKDAFKGCTSIEEVILPETITHIMENAFKGCKRLKKINFPPNLVYIGEYAFHRCHSLTRIELPFTIKHLNPCTFLYCDSLEYISMPGVIHLDKQVFLNDVKLKTIEISSDLEISCICDVFTGCNKITQINLFCGTTFNVENAIDIISSQTDIHPIVREIVIDIYRMMEIKDGILLKFLTNLKNVEIPNGIIGIGKSCFFDKKGIVSLKLPSTLTYIESKAFRNCINLEKIEFANEKVIISQDAFKNCTTLKYILLSGGIKYELHGLPNIIDKNIPSLVHTIHSQLLSNFFISGTTLIKYRGSEERVVIPDGITIIGEKAFAGNETIGRMILPDSIRRIEEEAFSDCVLLQTINLPKELEYIGKSAFENCVKLIRVQLPEKLTVIEKSTFNRCKKLNEVHFGKKIKQIDSLAFYNCHSLNNIYFPENLISIGDMAFYQCFSLKKITLPKSLCKLGNNIFTASGVRSAIIECDLKECGTDIFSQCNKLKELTFHEGVRYIGDKFAFNCVSLKTVNLPSSIEYIGRNVFEESIYLKEVVQNVVADKIFLDGSNLSGDIILDDKITVIAGGAFYGNTKLTSITMPNSLVCIGSRAFCGCTSLKEIILPKNITVLEEGVFSYCTSLEKVISHGKISYITDNAFYGCNKILHVPSSEANSIGRNAFNGCERLDNIKINCSDIDEDAFRNTPFLDKLRTSSALVIISDIIIDGKYCTGDIIIPHGITSISPFAFSGNTNITSITFSNHFISIGEGAFYGCKNLEKIQFPSTVKYIGKRAFEKCISLIEISGNIQEIDEGAYLYCINLKSVILKSTIAFKKETFCGCTALKICTCKELQYIGDNCFSGCDSLETFDFSTIKLIGHSAFLGCNSLHSISIKSDTSISAHAFEDCGCLEEIILSSEELKYGSYAFTGCTALKIISIDKKKYRTDNYLILFDVNIPDIVKSIYNSALSCFHIDENFSLSAYTNKGRFVHIPAGIKKIECEVFKDARNLEKITIPESVEYIGSRAFYGTMWLEQQNSISSMVIMNNILLDASMCQGNVVIPDNIKIISGWAFANCFALTGVTFFSCKTIVEEYAFRNCINLKKVITADRNIYKITDISSREKELPSTIKQIFIDCLNCFKTDNENVLIECTGNIANLSLVEGITAIGDNVFKDSNVLTYIILTNQVTIIGKNAFEHCRYLLCVKNAIMVRRIENFAFSGCSLLKSIELSDELEYIGIGAFEHCTSLLNIIIPEGITKIPERAFYRCKNLKTISLPSTLKIIGKEAFAFCCELTEINFPKGIKKIDKRAFAWCSNLKLDYNLEDKI